MLFNIHEHRPQTNIDCLACPYFDKQEKRCKGIGKRCFEFDKKTGAIYDPVTHLPLKLK